MNKGRVGFEDLPGFGLPFITNFNIYKVSAGLTQFRLNVLPDHLVCNQRKTMLCTKCVFTCKYFLQYSIIMWSHTYYTQSADYGKYKCRKNQGTGGQ